MTVPQNAELTTGVFAVATATTELLMPMDPWMEKLGVVGVLVAAVMFMLKWMMRQLEKKDERIQAITEAATRAQEASTAQLVAVLRANHDAIAAAAEKDDAMRMALQELTMTLRHQATMKRSSDRP